MIEKIHLTGHYKIGERRIINHQFYTVLPRCRTSQGMGPFSFTKKLRLLPENLFRQSFKEFFGKQMFRYMTDKPLFLPGKQRPDIFSASEHIIHIGSLKNHSVRVLFCQNCFVKSVNGFQLCYGRSTQKLPSAAQNRCLCPSIFHGKNQLARSASAIGKLKIRQRIVSQKMYQKDYIINLLPGKSVKVNNKIHTNPVAFFSNTKSAVLNSCQRKLHFSLHSKQIRHNRNPQRFFPIKRISASDKLRSQSMLSVRADRKCRIIEVPALLCLPRSRAVSLAEPFLQRLLQKMPVRYPKAAAEIFKILRLNLTGNCFRDSLHNKIRILLRRKG